MIKKAIILAFVILAAAPVPAPAQAADEDVYYVRNETPRAFTCGLRREPGRKVYRFLLRSGQHHVQALSGGNERTLLCDSQPAVTQRFRLRPGMRYSLVDREGIVHLRALGSARPD